MPPVSASSDNEGLGDHEEPDKHRDDAAEDLSGRPTAKTMTAPMAATAGSGVALARAEVDVVADHADLSYSVIELCCSVGDESVFAVKGLRPRVRVGHPQRHRLGWIDNRVQQHRPGP